MEKQKKCAKENEKVWKKNWESGLKKMRKNGKKLRKYAKENEKVWKKTEKVC